RTVYKYILAVFKIRGELFGNWLNGCCRYRQHDDIFAAHRLLHFSGEFMDFDRLAVEIDYAGLRNASDVPLLSFLLVQSAYISLFRHIGSCNNTTIPVSENTDYKCHTGSPVNLPDILYLHLLHFLSLSLRAVLQHRPA